MKCLFCKIREVKVFLIYNKLAGKTSPQINRKAHGRFFSAYIHMYSVVATFPVTIVISSFQHFSLQNSRNAVNVRINDSGEASPTI